MDKAQVERETGIVRRSSSDERLGLRRVSSSVQVARGSYPGSRESEQASSHPILLRESAQSLDARRGGVDADTPSSFQFTANIQLTSEPKGAMGCFNSKGFRLALEWASWHVWGRFPRLANSHHIITHALNVVKHEYELAAAELFQARAVRDEYEAKPVCSGVAKKRTEPHPASSVRTRDGARKAVLGYEADIQRLRAELHTARQSSGSDAFVLRPSDVGVDRDRERNMRERRVERDIPSLPLSESAITRSNRWNPLSTALASRFHDITSNRGKLDNEIRFQAEKQTKAMAKLQMEHDELQKTLSTIIARLQLGGPAPPFRLPFRPSDHRGTEQRHSVSSAPTEVHSTFPRSRSPAPGIRSPAPRIRSPAPRSRSPAIGGSMAKRPKILGFLTIGPLSNSPLLPRDFFKSLITESLPTFNLSSYDAILNPDYKYHLRVTLDSSNDMKMLIAMWETGSRTIKMREMPSGSRVESVSAMRSQDRLNDRRSAYVSHGGQYCNSVPWTSGERGVIPGKRELGPGPTGFTRHSSHKSGRPVHRKLEDYDPLECKLVVQPFVPHKYNNPPLSLHDVYDVSSTASTSTGDNALGSNAKNYISLGAADYPYYVLLEHGKPLSYQRPLGNWRCGDGVGGAKARG
ncbi:hypothetical protein B0H13DRAFT_1851412 [Mycena leptocephala]|nr:hypothetical protein B0H13DRAFT_1851412 [Mycena leptocephala]